MIDNISLRNIMGRVFNKLPNNLTVTANKLLVDGSGSSVILNQRSLDARGSLSVSEKTTLGNYVMDKDNLSLLLSRVGTGTQTYSNGKVTMSVTSGQYAICQSFQRHPYYAGKSQVCEITFEDFGLDNNVVKEVGLYTTSTAAPYNTSYDGIFFEADGVGIDYNLCIANANTGIVTKIPQSSWNVDKLDGTGISGVTQDFTKFTVMIADFLYLGGTAVRFGFKNGEIFNWCHVHQHANFLDDTIFSTPHLPVRWSIRSTTGSGSCKQICAAVHTEGTKELVGMPFSTPPYTNVVNANTQGTTYLVNGLRLANTANGAKTNILNVSWNVIAGTSDDVVVSLRLNPTISGAPVWAAVNANSNVEFATPDLVGNPSTTTVTGGTILYQSYIGSVNREAPPTALTLTRRLGLAIDGTREVLALCVTPLSTGTNADVFGLINFQEY